MKVGDKVGVHTTQGKQTVEVLDISGGVVTVKHPNGETAKYYLKDLTQA